MLKDSFLELNVGKTKELVLGYSSEREARRSVVTDQREVEMVDSFKYLGTIIDKKLTFNQHADTEYNKSQQRLFLHRKLKSFLQSAHMSLNLCTEILWRVPCHSTP